MRYRLLIEVEYFIALCEIPLPQLASINPETFDSLRALYQQFNEMDARRIKEIEKITNHDVKAVEYFLKEKMDTPGQKTYQEFVHFGLTSQDINNTAIPLLLKEALDTLYQPALDRFLNTLELLADQWADMPMLARTHGQAASPTRVGKELMVFVERLYKQTELLAQLPHSAKFGGATGNFNAHQVAFPQVNWVSFANALVNRFGLSRSQITTQIEHYDNLAALLDNLRRINTILVDFSRDMWHYISLDYFTQKLSDLEVGSSAMPHKVNPIDFENAEGNLGVANTLFSYLSDKLPISRLQRDLTDSTVLRNLGVPLAHTLIALDSLAKGLSKLELHPETLHQDLEKTGQW